VDTNSAAAKSEAYPVQFDAVVIATPHQFSNISHARDLFQHPIDDIPYVTLHVTLFATTLRFDPLFFDLEPGMETPISVLTTLGEDEKPRPGGAGVGKAGFFSATLIKTVTNPKTLGTEFVYKIFSPDKVTPQFLSRLLGVDIPDTFTGSSTKKAGGEDEPADEPISWYHAAVFHPYPQELPRVTFQDPILRQGLYYTSGMESFISTMETNALMGKNVARLIVDDYTGVKRGYAVSEDAAGLAQDQQQVLEDTPRAITEEL
jgi:prenylcysteine oxidase / farnesylcysteine lyase